MFNECPISVPYWLNYEDKDSRYLAIDSYSLNQELNEELKKQNTHSKKRAKI